MERGNIPGFYFDEEKQKYFTIQPNHIVPAKARYAEGQVKQEKRKSKKRKIEQHKRTVRLQQTVKRNPLLQHPVASGIGLVREHGTRLPLNDLDARDRALISAYHPQTEKYTTQVVTKSLRLSSAHYVPATKQMISGFNYPSLEKGLVTVHDWDWNGKPRSFGARRNQAIFNHAIKSITSTVQGGTPRMLVCANSGWNGGLFYSGPIDSHDVGAVLPETQSNFKGTKVPEFATFHHQTGKAATLSRDRIYLLDPVFNLVNQLRQAEASLDSGPEFGPGMDWLDYNTIAFNFNIEETKHMAMLWDTRTSGSPGTSARFKCSTRTTGVVNPSTATQDGFQLLLSTNKHINLFDIRMPHSPSRPDKALLSLPHTHQGPMQQHATNGKGLIAALDREETVQIYSIRSGRHMGSFEVPQEVKGDFDRPYISDLMWYDDESSGPCLQACGPAGVVRWTWGGSR